MCVSSSFLTRLRSVSLLQGRKDDRCVYSLERTWPVCPRHCSSILDGDREFNTMFNITGHARNTTTQSLIVTQVPLGRTRRSDSPKYEGTRGAFVTFYGTFPARLLLRFMVNVTQQILNV